MLFALSETIIVILSGNGLKVIIIGFKKYKAFWFTQVFYAASGFLN